MAYELPVQPAEITGSGPTSRPGLAEQRGVSGVLAIISWAEHLIHFAVAALLVVLAGYVLYRAGSDFVTGDQVFADKVTSAVNGVLFVIIVMELFRTVMAHFDESGFQLKPFLVIGIISSIRHMLTVGAQLSLGADKGNTAFRQAQIELSVSSGVVLVLVIGLILVHRSGALDN